MSKVVMSLPRGPSPACRAGATLERADHVGRDPAAVEPARLRLHPNPVDVACNPPRLERHILEDVLESGERVAVPPAYRIQSQRRGPDGGEVLRIHDLETGRETPVPGSEGL